MSGLAWASLRHRATAFTATFAAVLLGTIMIGSFATLVETATGPVSDADAETLTTMGAVVGGWGSMIVLFSVASTLGITVRQRATEVGLLRAVGATPRQARRMVRAEALLVTVVAAGCGALVAAVTGLLASGAGAVGYLLKDRVADVDAFLAAVRQVAGGGTVLDPEVVAALVSGAAHPGPLARLTPREQEVLV